MKSKLKLVNARTADQWIEIIQSKWQDSVKGVMDVGLALHNSREELGKPAFWQMVRENLRYSDGAVKQLIQIGTDARLMEAESVSTLTLPSSWTTLYALTGLTDEQFQRGIDTGVIHAGMERKDVALLKPPKEKPAAPPPLTGTDLVEARTFDARQTIVKFLRTMKDGEQSEFIALLRFQLDDIEERMQRGAAP